MLQLDFICLYLYFVYVIINVLLLLYAFNILCYVLSLATKKVYINKINFLKLCYGESCLKKNYIIIYKYVSDGSWTDQSIQTQFIILPTSLKFLW